MVWDIHHISTFAYKYSVNLLRIKTCNVAAILKDSDFQEADRAECQFTTTATVLDNGTQVCYMMYTEKKYGFSIT